MRWLKRFGYFLLFLYMMLCTVLYFQQERILFRPDKLPESYDFRTGEEVEVPVEEDLTLNCLWMKEPPSKGVILYLHGNRGSNRRCLHQAMNMAGNGYDIFMPDYRGYGKSEGEIRNDEQLFADVQQVYDFLKNHYPEDKIVLVGYSIGSGMASYLAANNQPQQLILLSPYYSMIDMKDQTIPIVPDFVLKYHLRNDRHLEQVHCPVTLFHGTEDRIIPFHSSEKLQALQPKIIELVVLKGEGHRGTIFNDLFRRRISDLLR